MVARHGTGDLIRLRPPLGLLLVGAVWAGAASAATLALPLLFSRLVSELAAPRSGTIALLAAVLIGRAVFAYAAGLTFGQLGTTAVVDLRRRLVARFFNASLAEHDNARRGDLVAALTVDAVPAQRWHQTLLPAAMIHVPVVVLGAVWLLYSRPGTTTLVALMVVPALALGYYLSATIRSLGRRSQQTLAALGALVAEALADIRWLKTGGGWIVHDAASDLLAQQLDLKRRLVHRTAACWAVVPALLAGAVAVAIVRTFGGVGVDPGEATQYVALLLLVTASMVRLTMLWVQRQSAWGGLDRIEALGGRFTEEERSDHGCSDWRELRLESVHFAYRHGHEVLRGVDLTVPASTSWLVCGPNGSGKSSLLDVAMGLRAPTSGRLCVDGRALGAGELPRWRAQIGYAGPEPALLATSLAGNLRVNGGAPPEDMHAALETVGLHLWLAGLPAGLEEQLGEGGRRLSRGQRQRLALARLLLTDSRLIVLDEAIGSIDPDDVARILSALANLPHSPAILLAVPTPIMGFDFDRRITLHDGLVRHELEALEAVSG